MNEPIEWITFSFRIEFPDGRQITCENDILAALWDEMHTVQRAEVIETFAKRAAYEYLQGSQA